MALFGLDKQNVLVNLSFIAWELLSRCFKLYAITEKSE